MLQPHPAPAAAASEYIVFRAMRKLIWASLLGLAALTPARAETIVQALSAAYSSNPQINSARAGTRAQDEAVPIARSFYRPTVTATGDITRAYSDPPPQSSTDKNGTIATAGISIEQFVFRGFRTRNAVRGAEADVRASRENLANTVQNVLFDAADAYLSVIRDQAILDIRRRNADFLREQVRAANERFNVGENTRTDVAQARARLSSALSDISIAEANLATSVAIYRQVIGNEPRNLSSGFPFASALPASLASALDVAQARHPAILAAVYTADSAAFNVKEVEGELLPSVSITGSVARDFGISGFYEDEDQTSASITGRVSIPLYQGGSVSARVRQAKELLGQSQVEIDLYRDQVRAAVVSSWGQIEATSSTISAAGSAVEAANIALSGVQEEQRVGQRTTLDVLDAQAEVLSARESLIQAQYNHVLSSFSLLSATGRLLPEALGLPVATYRPEQHYDAVKDKWYGLRTPDGR